MLLSYKARNHKGELVTGQLEAFSESVAISQLREKELTPIKVEIMVGATLKQEKMTKIPSQNGRVEIRDMMFFCINLSNMVSAGIPLLGSLNIISMQMNNPYLGAVIGYVGKLVSEGTSFSDSLGKFPKVFSRLFVNMIRLGEMSGTLEKVLKTLAIYMEQQENLRQKIHGALIYPTILVVAGTGVILLILTFVMPQFVTIFQKSGVALPAATQLMYNIGTWMKRFWFLPLGAGVLLVFGVKMFLKTKTGRNFWHRLLLKLPLFGPVTIDILVARFSRTLGTLMDHGVPLLQSLNILEDVIDNVVFEEIVQTVRLSAEKGEGLHKPLMNRQEFPKDVVYMISVGEQSGQIGPMLNKVADFYESKVEFAIKGLLVYIEPIFICFMAVVVGIMLASVILPMFDLVKTIQQ
ncbi:MAG TPA: type II secretion system F family protein [Candidatus Omnitrophota bacterium]|mgnify:CR=1 FL=1|nr:type II secretion system F family protein [Candidatus Omnitrophota bacterium]